MAPKKWSDKNCCCKIVQKVTLKWRQKNGQTKTVVVKKYKSDPKMAPKKWSDKNCCCKIVQKVTLKWRQRNGQTEAVAVK